MISAAAMSDGAVVAASGSTSHKVLVDPRTAVYRQLALTRQKLVASMFEPQILVMKFLGFSVKGVRLIMRLLHRRQAFLARRNIKDPHHVMT